MSEKTDMNAVIRRAAFGVSADEMAAEMRNRKKRQPKSPATMSDWLREQYRRSRGITINDETEEQSDDE